MLFWGRGGGENEANRNILKLVTIYILSPKMTIYKPRNRIVYMLGYQILVFFREISFHTSIYLNIMPQNLKKQFVLDLLTTVTEWTILFTASDVKQFICFSFFSLAYDITEINLIFLMQSNIFHATEWVGFI